MDGTHQIRALYDWDFIGYTVVARSEDRYEALRSCADERVEYQLGLKHEQADTLAGADASGFQVACMSLCVSPTPLAAVRSDLCVSRSGFEKGKLALLWCSCEGPVYEDPEGRLVCSKLTPLGEVNLPEAFVREVPESGAGKPQPGAGYFPTRRKSRSRDNNHGSNSARSISVSTPKTSVASPTKIGGRLGRQRPGSACGRVTSNKQVGGPSSNAATQELRQPKSSPSQPPKEVPATEQAPTPPRRPQSAPSYRPSSRLHTVLTRWGTPGSEGFSKQQGESESAIGASGDDVLRPTRPAAPRPYQPRQGLWVGRSAQLSGCV